MHWSNICPGLPSNTVDVVRWRFITPRHLAIDECLGKTLP